MEMASTFFCGICGSEKVASGEEWFLISESRWQDRLKILRWHDQLATQHGLHCACSAAHVQELVIHWMITGSMEYPFARISPKESRGQMIDSQNGSSLDFDSGAAQQIGELSVHRESIRRVLAESPHSLTAILDALLAALGRPPKSNEPELEMESEELCLARG